MPKNPILRFGVYIVAACALLYTGAQVLFWAKAFFIYIGIAGIVMIVIGVLMEWQKSKNAVPSATSPIANPIHPSSTYLDDITKSEAATPVDAP
jgi:hypothetical protein